MSTLRGDYGTFLFSRFEKLVLISIAVFYDLGEDRPYLCLGEDRYEQRQNDFEIRLHFYIQKLMLCYFWVLSWSGSLAALETECMSHFVDVDPVPSWWILTWGFSEGRLGSFRSG
jgi:hypothetical protein